MLVGKLSNFLEKWATENKKKVDEVLLDEEIK
jgi:hypothetical protein